MSQIKINTESAAYKRLMTAGFTILQAAQRHDMREALYVRFKCVCGREEDFYTTNPSGVLPPEGWDVAAELEAIGAVSVEHLRRDGYSEEEIKHIRRAYA